MMRLYIDCHRCKTHFEFLADEEDVRDWQGGVLIQKAMPYLSIEEREILISGMCNQCFEELANELHD